MTEDRLKELEQLFNGDTPSDLAVQELIAEIRRMRAAGEVRK
jgi:hypothetical protein